MPDKLILGPAYPPFQDPIADEHGMLTWPWRDYFARLPSTLASIPNRVNTVSLSLRSSSVLSTDFSGSSLLAGLYRITYYAQITRPGTVSSSLTVSFGWTDGGVAQSFSGSAITGNTTTTHQSGTLLVRVDRGTEVTYATTYASVGATTMQYSLDVTLEKVLA